MIGAPHASTDRYILAEGKISPLAPKKLRIGVQLRSSTTAVSYTHLRKWWIAVWDWLKIQLPAAKNCCAICRPGKSSSNGMNTEKP